MKLDEIHRRLEAKKARKVLASLPNGDQFAAEFDLNGLVENLIRDEVARRVAALAKPADRESLPRHIERIATHMARSYRGVPAPVPSSVPAAEPYAVPRDVGRGAETIEMVVVARDEFGRIAAARFDSPKGTYTGTVTARTELGRVEKVRFERTAA